VNAADGPIRPLITLGALDAAVCADDVCAIPSDAEKVLLSLDEGSTDY
jgi:hypothetical protein